MNLAPQELYLNAKPFPYIAVDGLMPPVLVEEAGDEFPSAENKVWKWFGNPMELKAVCSDVSAMGEFTRDLLHRMCNQEMVDAISEMTGIPKLIPDLHGGGMHLVPRDGKLGVHTDFNRGVNGYRRVNALLFLNSNWDLKWGGDLELWAYDKSFSVHIPPIANRLVIFTTSSKSFHGHPRPLPCPSNRSRKSLAVYYFTQEPPADVEEPRGTVFLDV